jgi:drug/metabolite transporter (DMT)-like permease
MLGHVEASQVALITLMTPVIALFLGHEVNGETIGPRALAGTAVILTGLACYRRGDHWIRRRA